MNRGQQTACDDVLLTVREVAEVLRVSANCVYELVSNGKLVCYRVGIGRGAIRVRRVDVDAYLTACRMEKGEQAPRLPRPRLKHLTL
jgi:excisionase family DNA binding protein